MKPFVAFLSLMLLSFTCFSQETASHRPDPHDLAHQLTPVELTPDFIIDLGSTFDGVESKQTLSVMTNTHYTFISVPFNGFPTLQDVEASKSDRYAQNYNDEERKTAMSRFGEYNYLMVQIADLLSLNPDVSRFAYEERGLVLRLPFGQYWTVKHQSDPHITDDGVIMQIDYFSITGKNVPRHKLITTTTQTIEEALFYVFAKSAVVTVANHLDYERLTLGED